MNPLPRPPKPGALRANRFVLWLSRRWLTIATVLLGLYASLSIVTPVMMQLGLEGPARVLYTLYSPFCHQFAFRSLFLFGQQSAYPRAISGTSAIPYEVFVIDEPAFRAAYEYHYRRYHNNRPPDSLTLTDLTETFTPWFQFASRDFLGSPVMGYKMTLCARDIAIYLGIFGGALIYSIPVVRRRLRPVPILLYAFLGLGPIAIDGMSQLLGYPPFNLWEPRETLPIFRVVTGGLFGFMNAWLAFPYLEISMRETRATVLAKLARAGIDVRTL